MGRHIINRDGIAGLEHVISMAADPSMIDAMFTVREVKGIAYPVMGPGSSGAPGCAEDMRLSGHRVVSEHEFLPDLVDVGQSQEPDDQTYHPFPSARHRFRSRPRAPGIRIVNVLWISNFISEK